MAFWRQVLTHLARGDVISIDKSHPCQPLLPSPHTHTEGQLAGACQPWLPCPSPTFANAFADHYHQLCSYFRESVCRCLSWSPCPQSMGMCFLPPPLDPASWPSPSRDY